MPHRILVVESASAPESLRVWVDRSPDLSVWGHASAVSEALSALVAAQPDLILTASNLMGECVIELVSQVCSAHPRIPVLVASQTGDNQQVARSIRAGARGYVSHGSSQDAVLAAIRTVLTGHIVLPESAHPHFIHPSLCTNHSGSSASCLSDRQLDVLRLIGQGLTTTQIADQLNISPKTVETHRVNIKSKLGLGTANALIRWAALWRESNNNGMRPVDSLHERPASSS